VEAGTDGSHWTASRRCHTNRTEMDCSLRALRRWSTLCLVERKTVVGNVRGYGDRFGKKPKVDQIMQAGRSGSYHNAKFENSVRLVFFLR
jgi:hypothetical protein